MARPMPRLAPVTSAICFFEESIPIECGDAKVCVLMGQRGLHPIDSSQFLVQEKPASQQLVFAGVKEIVQ